MASECVHRYGVAFQHVDLISPRSTAFIQHISAFSNSMELSDLYYTLKCNGGGGSKETYSLTIDRLKAKKRK